MIRKKARIIVDHDSEWFCGDWRSRVQTLGNSSISLLLTDPPYGINYQSYRRKNLHRPLTGDKSLKHAVKEVSEMLKAFEPKLRNDAHILIFCSWHNEPVVRQIIIEAGFRLKGVIVWVKNNHGTGDLKGSFAPKHEWIIHAVKGRPLMNRRIANVIHSVKAPTDLHPTQKPVDLMQKLIEATTAPGELVADPFGGVATTLLAARNCGRLSWGCEIDWRYYRIGRNFIEKS